MINPTSDRKGSNRFRRGGGWNYTPLYVRTSDRGDSDPAYQNYSLGFRIVRNKV